MAIKKKKINGFTLIEILVVLGLLVVASVIGANMFFTTFRSSAKTKALTVVKQNGDYALSIMERLIRDSQEVITNSDDSLCAVGMNKIKIKRSDNSEIEFACLNEGTATGYIASNSARLINSEVKLDNCYFNCSTQGEFYPQSVTINFTLSQAGESARIEEQASVDFQTTVTTRNF